MSFFKRTKKGTEHIEITVTVKKGGKVVEKQSLASALLAGVKKRELNNMSAEDEGMATIKCQTILAGVVSPELAYEMSKAVKKSVTDTYGTKLLPFMRREIEERLGEVSGDICDVPEEKVPKSAGLELIDFAADEADSR